MLKTLAPLLSASTLVAGGFLVLTGMKSCGGSSSSETPTDDGDAVCKVASDCEGLPHVKCLGAWSCDDGQCNYQCGVDPDPDPGVIPNPYACSDDAQCGDGQACSFDYGCQPSACSPDGSICTTDCLGLCVDAPKPVVCTQNSDCAQGQWCDYTECVGTSCEGVCRGDEPPPPPAGCTNDSECKPGQYCALEVCPLCDCPDGNFAACTCPACTGTCKDQVVEPGCSDDSQCGDGMRCELICAPCAQPVDDGGAPWMPVECPCAGQCVPATPKCSTDAECGDGYYCQLEVCADCKCAADDASCSCPEPACWGSCAPVQVGNWCNTDAQCGAGMHCEVTQCYPCDPIPGEPGSCPPSPYCEGTCQYDVVNPGCNTDSDCPAGTSCQCTSDPSCPMCDVCFFQCLPVEPPPPVSCLSDAECGAGEYCAPAACAAIWCDPANEACAPCYGICQPMPVVSCASDADCAKGQVCQFSDAAGDAAFAPPCWDGFCPPVAGQCVDAAPPPSECQVSGCSGEICSAEPMASICIYSEWYQCLQYTTCGANAADGGCGWEQNDVFVTCLEKFGVKPF